MFWIILQISFFLSHCTHCVVALIIRSQAVEQKNYEKESASLSLVMCDKATIKPTNIGYTTLALPPHS
jgi:hypothetical protein